MRSNVSCLSRTNVEEIDVLSDHKAIFSTIAVKRPSVATWLVASRNVRATDSLGALNQGVDVRQEAESELVDVYKYNDGLSQILDRHAPLMTRRIRDRPSVPWLNDAARAAWRKRSKAERRWRAIRLTVHRHIFATERAAVKAAVKSAKKLYFNNKISACSSSKELFAASSDLLATTKRSPVPANISCSDLPECFCDFFSDKISTGTIPHQFKQAVVTPLLKKAGLWPKHSDCFKKKRKKVRSQIFLLF